MSTKFVAVRVNHFANGQSIEVQTVYNKANGWSHYDALKVEHDIAKRFGWEVYEVYIKPYDENDKPTNESHEWQDA
ncbi:hypothetical protein KMB85_gp52 [Escherichia phage vB_EcoS_W011D]|uniref:Uncharacterized protein n=1 Tax=Escherichia phage vB_EcoS_W011D TaxID=2575323 RepID=A0A4Y5NVS0_9CAUD|nr:hypothetical protein KMB85_gp52 [Escherichia phage vB_EcoS_W011D]QCW18498.1 hypothetical protein vBEcoSW011D_52 [Escherichia phage vB_EcoS_W011D]